MSNQNLERLHAALQPEKAGDLLQLNDFLGRFVARVISQTCMESVSLKAREVAGVPRIEGWVCYPAQLSALLSLAGAVPMKGIELEVSVLPSMDFNPAGSEHQTPGCEQESLSVSGDGIASNGDPQSSRPDSGEAASTHKIGDFRLGGEPSLFHSCRKPAVGHAQPDETSAVVHIWSVWDEIRPLHRLNGWTLCQAANGYLGWVDDTQLALEENPPPPHSFMPSQSLRMLAETALEYLGDPYLWGGTGSGGIDCSGFTAAVYERRGLVLPRDTHQQMLGGRIVATHDVRLPLRTGDLLFFTHADGCIGHVGLSLGEDKVIHAQEPRVCIFSMNPDDSGFDAYRSRHFVMAKRYLL